MLHNDSEDDVDLIVLMNVFVFLGNDNDHAYRKKLMLRNDDKFSRYEYKMWLSNSRYKNVQFEDDDNSEDDIINDEH